jgi:pimeloyl-ACP methyl ester carboxylesterase
LGKYELKRDVNLVKQLTITAPSDKNMDLWAYWYKVTIPTLVIRGELSDILSVKTLQRMQEINPETQVVEIANAGHAPFLYSEEHFSFLEKFLGA